jgi:hypothetical protein
MSHPKGLAALEAGENVERAELAMLDVAAQFSQGLWEATSALGYAKRNRPKRLSTAQRDLLDGIAEIVEGLKQDEG